jgi:peptide/nickel transport system permease protein
MTRHVLRNSLIPVITLFGLDFGAVLGGGAIVTEYLFGIEGVGYFTAEALKDQDFPSIMAVAIFGAFFIVLFNMFVDIAYAYLDPRIRLGTQASS